MSILFDHQLNPVCKGQIKVFHWHGTFPLLAVASIDQDSKNTSVVVYKEGTALSKSFVTRMMTVKALAWHPMKMILTIGWENGELTFQNLSDFVLQDIGYGSQTQLAFMLWNSDGSCLLTGDIGGWLTIWVVDLKGRPQSVPSYTVKMNDPSVLVALITPKMSSCELMTLARAAINGDEKALDMFSWKRVDASEGQDKDFEGWFVGGAQGNVSHVTSKGIVMHCFNADEPLLKLLYDGKKKMLITVTMSFILMMHDISNNNKAKEMMKVKLTGNPGSAEVIWAGNSILAVNTGTEAVRIFNVDTQENYCLRTSSDSSGPAEKITCIAYRAAKGMLAGGTSSGRLCLWKYCPFSSMGGKTVEPEDKWHLVVVSVVSEPIARLQFGSSFSCLAVTTENDIYILEEKEPSSQCSNGTSVVQTGSRTLSVDIFSQKFYYEIVTGIQVKGLCVTKDDFAVTDGAKVAVYEVFAQTPSTSFDCISCAICMHNKTIYTAETGKIAARNMKGVVKQLLLLPSASDEVLSMEICGTFLVVGLLSGFLVIFNLSRREAKEHMKPKCFQNMLKDFGYFSSVKCNSNCSKVSLIINKVDGSHDSTIYIWDMEADTLQPVHVNLLMAKQKLADIGNSLTTTAGDSNTGVSMAMKRFRGKKECFPVSLFWDLEEPMLFTCETDFLSESRETGQSQLMETSDECKQVLTLLLTSEGTSEVSLAFTRDHCFQKLLAFEMPFYYFMKKPEGSCMSGDGDHDHNHALDDCDTSLVLPGIDPHSMTVQKVHRDFVGMQDADKTTKDAMMKFSMNMTLGNMDEAFKAIRLIKSEVVWEGVAKMCIKTQRLDVARVCLANMSHPRGAKMLREAEKEPEVECHLASLAIQLGLNKEAERLLKVAKRYDLLNSFYQSCGRWMEAISTAQSHDRINLRSTYYNYAKHLESIGQLTDAINYFEKSGTQSYEVPRMMLHDMDFLKSYILKSNDKTMLKWLGRYMVSHHRMDCAIDSFEAAEDYLSLVEIYCLSDDHEKANQVCDQTGDSAACLHLGHVYEQWGDFDKAISLFMRARSYSNAIRISMQEGYNDRLVNMAFLGSSDDLVQVARYFETRPDHVDTAVMLYHKAGLRSKAVELAFESRNSSAMQFVSDNLSDVTDPLLLQKSAEFFISTSQFDRAINLLATARRFDDALMMCRCHHIPMTDSLVERLTPQDTDDMDQERRADILETIGDICMAQNQYLLAAKKFNQAKNVHKSMLALIKHGDMDMIIQFAKVCRQRELYILAGHFLQTLDWKQDVKIMRYITEFYQKGRSYDSLARFYDCCAQLEIDEYQNYMQALEALNLSLEYLIRDKTKTEDVLEKKKADLNNRIFLIKKFLTAKSKNDETSMKLCQDLLSESNCNAAVRLADIYGFMVEHYASKEQWTVAYGVLEKMRSCLPRVDVRCHIDMSTLDCIQRALKKPLDISINYESVYTQKAPESYCDDEYQEVLEDFDDDV